MQNNTRQVPPMVPTRKGVVVGWLEPPAGSSVTATAVTGPSGTATRRISASPSGSDLNVTEGTGFPSRMNQSW